MTEIYKKVTKLLEGNPLRRNLSLAEVDHLSFTKVKVLCLSVLEELVRESRNHGEQKNENDEMQNLEHYMKLLKFNDIDGLLNESKEAALNALILLLENQEKNSMRLYLAKYLTRIELTPDCEFDDECINLHEEVNLLQTRFKESHKRYLTAQKSAKEIDLQKAKKENEDLDRQSIALSTKLEQIDKLAEQQSDPKFDDLVNQLIQLDEMEEKSKQVISTIQQQNLEIKSFEKEKEVLVNELKQYRELSSQAESKHGDEDILHFITRQVETKQNLLSKLEEDLSELKEKKQKLALNVDDVTEKDVNDKEQELNTITDELKTCENQIDEEIEGDDDRIKIVKLFRQQQKTLNLSRMKREKMLQALKEEVVTVQKEVDTLKTSMSKSGTKAAPRMTKVDFEKYAQCMRDLTTQFKKNKQTLDLMQEEAVILSQTESHLKSLCTGDVTEFQKVRSEIEQKTDSSEAELSKEIKRVQLEIDEAAAQVAPLQARIQDLQHKINTNTNNLKEEQVPMLEAIEEFNVTKRVLQEKRARKNESVSKLHSDIFEKQFELEMMEKKLEIVNGSKFDLHVRSLEAEIEECEKSVHDLQSQKQELTANRQHALEQMKQFTDLASVLECSLECARDRFCEMNEGKEESFNVLKL